MNDSVSHLIVSVLNEIMFFFFINKLNEWCKNSFIKTATCLVPGEYVFLNESVQMNDSITNL